MGPSLLGFLDDYDLFYSITGDYNEAASLYSSVCIAATIISGLICAFIKRLLLNSPFLKCITSFLSMIPFVMEIILLHYLELFKTQISWLYSHPWMTIVIFLVVMTIMSCLKNFVIDIYNKIRNKSNSS